MCVFVFVLVKEVECVKEWSEHGEQKICRLIFALFLSDQEISCSTRFQNRCRRSSFFVNEKFCCCCCCWCCCWGGNVCFFAIFIHSYFYDRRVSESFLCCFLRLDRVMNQLFIRHFFMITFYMSTLFVRCWNAEVSWASADFFSRGGQKISRGARTYFLPKKQQKDTFFTKKS